MATSGDDSERARQAERLEMILRTHRERLLQISRRNRSVQFKRTVPKHSFDLAELEGFGRGVCGRISAGIISGGAAQNILPDSVEGEDADAARGRLRRLSYNLRQIEDETGRQTGFVGFPFLQGHADADFFIRGPLVLFPVSLERRRQARGGGWVISPLGTGPVLNGALISAIKRRADLGVPDDMDETFDRLIEDLEDHDGSDIEEYFVARIGRWIGGIIPIDGSRNDMSQARIPPLTKMDIEKKGIEKFHLLNYKVLGNFPQADNEIYKDYSRLLETASLDTGPLGDLIDVYDPDQYGDSDHAEIDLDTVDDSRLNTVLDSDSSQDRVILESKRSGFVVVRGPPGTGKSQVITNLISDALSNGRKVLVVCQKRAALDVVRQRLGKVGLERFAVMLDKEHEDRRGMYAQLYDTIRDPGGHADPSRLGEISGQINECTRSLSELGRALHRQYFGTATAQKIYAVSDGRYNPRLDMSRIGPDVAWDGLDGYLQKIRGLEPMFKEFEAPGHPWRGRISLAESGLRDRAGMYDTIRNLRDMLPGSLLARTPEEQGELVGQFKTFLDNPGFLKRNRKSAARRIAALLGRRDVTEQYVRDNMQAARSGAEFLRALQGLLGLFGPERHAHFYQLCRRPGDMGEELGRLEDSLSDYDRMRGYDARLRGCDPGIVGLLRACRTAMDPSEDWTDAIRQEIYSYWIDEIERENPVLRGDPVGEYTQNSRRLGELLDAKREATRREIHSAIAGAVTIPDISGRARTPEARVWKEFSAELKKKRRQKPVRRLFEEYAENFLKIAPCWLASPEAVCKVFPLRRRLFDLVIVDEASQLPVERALPFLYRADSVVIAGDEKQLQPFDLFQVRDDDGEDAEEKSLLDLAMIHHHPIQLAWHYRSKYQDLIDFSNHAFYGGMLQVAPNVRTDPAHPPVRWAGCDGMWDEQQNHAEAARVLDEIRDLWSRASGTGRWQSVGVITFNEPQQELIQEQFAKRLDEDAEFYRLYTHATDGRGVDERPFFKNIENVQGDERDVIIFSIGYARNPDGVFHNRFGTLGARGGQNRLNVAITRAREEMVVVCSIDPSEIKGTGKNEGPRRLRQFLEYARACSQSDREAVDDVLHRISDSTAVKPGAAQEFESPFEQQVCRALQDRGYEVHTQIGSSGYRIDLAVVHPDDPDRYVLAVECDGASFHSAKSAKERDVMRQRFLEGKGWRIERIWSRNWWRDPGAEIDRIASVIDKAVAG